MPKDNLKNFSWDFYSRLIIISYCFLQILRWRILPQFMDIYYHLLTAWGFIQAGGYSGWDFWQYAPFGRMHIYPPVFHLILAVLMKIGASPTILAKFFETAMPAVFLLVLWNFVRKNYNGRLAFFTVVAFSSSFSFYLSLLNHIPATLALVFGFLALGQLLTHKPLRALLLLALCFYTHIGVSWLFALGFLFYGLLNRECRKSCLLIFVLALIAALPILFKQLMGLKVISSWGLNLNEKYLIQFKIIDYALAFFGLILAFKAEMKYRLFVSLFLASFVFVIYPYRFFSAEGYLPIILLSALSLDKIYTKAQDKNLYLKYLPVAAIVFILLFSPTISLDTKEKEILGYKVRFGDSAFMGMLFAKGGTIWFPRDYLPAADLIRNNSETGDIIYCNLPIAGMILASISARSTANALLPEIGPSRRFDPFSVSRIIIFTKDSEPAVISGLANAYKLTKIGETKIFALYKNPLCQVKVAVSKASVPFWAILFITLILILLFLR